MISLAPLCPLAVVFSKRLRVCAIELCSCVLESRRLSTNRGALSRDDSITEFTFSFAMILYDKRRLGVIYFFEARNCLVGRGFERIERAELELIIFVFIFDHSGMLKNTKVGFD